MNRRTFLCSCAIFLLAFAFNLVFSSALQGQTAGSLVPCFNTGTGFNGNTNVYSRLPNGQILCAGDFTQFNGTLNVNRICRLNTDGSLDAGFTANVVGGANLEINCMAVLSNGQILISGSFTDYNGTPRGRIARLNANGSLDMTFAVGAGATSGCIKFFSVQSDGKIVVVGDAGFTSYNGTTVNAIARLNADGTLDAAFNSGPGSGFNGGSINTAVTIQTDGKILVGGNFTSYKNQPVPAGIIRLNSDGTRDNTFNPGTTGGVSSGSSVFFPIIVQSNGQILICGNFSTYNGVPHNSLARLNSDGSIDNSFNPAGPNVPGVTMAQLPDGRLVITGSILGQFTQYDGVARGGVALTNSNGNLDLTFNPVGSVGQTIWACFAFSDGTGMLGGDNTFTTYNSTNVNGIARIWLTSPAGISSTSPQRNTHNNALSTPLNLNFTQAMSAGTASQSALRIWGGMTGLRSGTYSGGGSSTIGFTPSQAYRPGELVSATLRCGAQTNAGTPVQPSVVQFRARAGVGPATFSQTSTPVVGADARTSVTADFDGDGDLDLAVGSPSQVDILLNDGTGTFTPSINYPSASFGGLQPWTITSGDFDNDGDVDIAVAATGAFSMPPFNLYILHNNGNATFTVGGSYGLLNNVWHLASADLDGDGDLDLAVANTGGSTVSILLNNGTGIFTTGTNPGVGSNPRCIAPADFDNDGDIDLAVGNQSNNVNILLNNGNGTFNAGQNITMSVINPVFVAAGDLNGDGTNDLAIANAGSTTVAVFTNNGTGVFTQVIGTPSSPFSTTSSNPVWLTLGDFDGDGDQDIATANFGANDMSILLNNGSAVFPTATKYPAVQASNSLSVGDFDGDGDLDMAVTNSGGGLNGTLLSIFKNAGAMRIQNHVAPYTASPTVYPTRNSNNAGVGSAVGAVFTQNVSSATIATPSKHLYIHGNMRGKRSGSFITSPANSLGANSLTQTPARGEQFWVTTKDIRSTELVQAPSFVYGFRTAAGTGPGTFLPVQTLQQNITTPIQGIPVEGFVEGVTSGYFNADPYLDFAVAVNDNDTPTGGIEVFFGNASAGFTSVIISDAAGLNLSRVEVADMDNDGDADLVAAGGSYSGSAYTVYVFRNNGNSTGTFTLIPSPLAPLAPDFTQIEIAITDMDADGDLDVFTVSDEGGYKFFFNDGTGALAAGASFNFPGLGAAAGDIDNDGDIDLAYTNFPANTVYTLINDGTGSYSSGQNLVLPNSMKAYSTRLADIDNDGWLDLIALETNNFLVNSRVQIYRNITGVFTATPQSISLQGILGTGTALSKFIPFDADGDGDLDIAVGVFEAGSVFRVYVIPNNSGVFGTPVGTTVTHPVGAICAGDADNDGDLDLIVAGDAKITVLRNGYPQNVQNNVAPFTATVPVSPVRNTNTALLSPTISIPFAQNVSTATASNAAQKHLFVHGMMRGKRTATHSVSPANTLNASSLMPSFLRGEQVWVTTKWVRSFEQVEQTRPFVYGFRTAAGVGPANFIETQRAALGGSAFSTAVGDIDWDGDADVITLGSAGIEVLRNDGTGNFTVSTPLPESPGGITLGDVDNDGDIDIVLTTSAAGQARVYKNNGIGSFTPQTAFGVGGTYPVPTLADMDADGDLDLIATKNAGNLDVFLNDGTGAFSFLGSYFSGGSTPNGTDIGDVDGDGDLDVVVTNNGSNDVGVMLNNGSGVLTTPSGITLLSGFGDTPTSLALGDVDGDGDLDLAVVSGSSSPVPPFLLSIRLNNGAGDFSASAPGPFTISNPNSSSAMVKFADVDGDGDLDVITGSQGASAVNVRLNNGAGDFNTVAAGAPFPTGTAPFGLATGDVDGDGDMDIVTVNISGTVSILKNTAQTLLTSFTPPRNSMTLAASAALGLTFNQPMTTATASVQPFRVWGGMRGFRAAVYSQPGGAATAQLTPSPPLLPNESVLVSVVNAQNPNRVNAPPVVLSYRAASGTGPATFFAVPDQSLGSTPSPARYIAAADFNSDGRADVAISNPGRNSIQLMYSAGNGTFTQGILQGVSATPGEIATADLNNDGRPDLVASVSGNAIDVLLNTGGGSFGRTSYSTSMGARGLAIADYNNDGILDIAVCTGNNVEIFVGTGNGIFASWTTVSLPSPSYKGIAAADVDNDGDMDIVAAPGNTTDLMQLCINNGGSSGFAVATGIAGTTVLGAEYLTAADFNNDGNMDVATSSGSMGGAFIGLLTGNGLGSFTLSSFGGTGASYGFNDVGDFNGDGRLDIANADMSANLQIWLNNGSSFTQSGIAQGASGIAPVPIDADGDRDLDLVATFPFSSDNFRVFLNQPAPTLLLNTPTLNFGTLTVGQFATQTATLTGTNLVSPASISITRATVGAFSFGAGISALTTQGTVYVTGATFSTSIQARFTPTTSGTFSTTITVTTANAAPLTLTLIGVGVLPRVPTPPIITALSTNAALIGVPITVSGLYFANVSQASVGGISTTVNVISATEATVIIPMGLSIGVVVFANSDGEGVSRDSVRALVPYSPPPLVTAAAPLVGVAGDIVRVTGANFSTGATTLLVGGMQYGSAFISTTQLTFSLLAGMQGAIGVRTPNGSTTSSFIVRVIPPPVIQSITPTEASTGATFTIIGRNFENLRSVTAANMRLDSTSWSVDSLAQRVTVRVLENTNAGTTIGSITLVTRSGEARFTPIYEAPGSVILPNILSILPVGITPPNGGQAEILIQEGNEIQLQVQNIPTGATITLFINGVPTTLATVQTSASLTTLRLALPIGLVPLGQISISSILIALTAGTRTTTATFAFPVQAVLLPHIASFTPSVGGTCSTISIRGANFGLQPRGTITNVLVGGTPVRGFRIVSQTLIQATAGTVRSGAVTLITSSGAISTTAQFTFDPNFPCLPAMRREDSLALDAFYVATVGPNWTTSSNWTNPDVPAALRFGVKTVGDRVTEIRLPANNLSGSIPEAVMRGLLALKAFDVNDNRIADVLPRALAEATNLETLRLRGNRFTRTLPNVGALTKLRELDVSKNSLDGSIEAIAGAEALETLDVSSNRFTGRLDAGIGRLTNLRFLNLSRNQLSGDLPQELGQLREMQSLLLRGNRFTGALPRALGQDATLAVVKRTAQNQAAQNLEVLDVGANALSGTIPEEFGNITTLKQLCLDSNTFTGSIPPALLALTRLRRLEAGYNRLSGEIPDFRSIARLDTFAVEGNRYTVAALEPLAGMQTYRYVPQDFDERRIVATFQNASGATISTTASILTLTLNEPLTLSLPRTESFSRIEWRKNGLPLANSDTSPHAAFTIPAFSLADTGVYECVITNDRLDKIALKTASLHIQGQLPTTPPAAVRLITPSLGEEDVAAELPFGWTSSLYATQYRIELATDTSFAQVLSSGNLPQSVQILSAARALIQRGSSASTATQTLPTFFGSAFPLVAGRVYAWRVRAENGVGASAWATGTFTTALPGEAVTVLPLDFGRVAMRDTSEGMLTVRNLSDIALRLESLTANNVVFTPDAIPPGTVLAARGEFRLKVRAVSATPGNVLAGVTVGFRASASGNTQTRTQQNRLAVRIQAVKLIAPLLDTVIVGRKTITTLQLVNLTDKPVLVRSAALMRKIPAYVLNNAPVGFEIQARDTVPFLLETTAQSVGAVGEELLECTVLRDEATPGSGGSRDLSDTVQTSFRAVARKERPEDRFIVVSLKPLQDSIAPGSAVTLELTVRPTGDISFKEISSAAAPGFSARLRWNTDVLTLSPEERGVRKTGAVAKDGMQSFSVPQSFWDGRSPTLLTIRGISLAGRTDITPITIESLQWGAGTVFVILLENSTFVAKACEAGGKRLVTSAKPTQLAVIAPNPAKEQVSVNYTLREDGFTEIALIDANGKTAQILVSEEQAAGEYSITRSLKGLPSGAYTMRLTTRGGVVSRGLNVVR